MDIPSEATGWTELESHVEPDPKLWKYAAKADHASVQAVLEQQGFLFDDDPGELEFKVVSEPNDITGQVWHVWYRMASESTGKRGLTFPKSLGKDAKLAVDVTYGNDEGASIVFLVPTPVGDRIVKLIVTDQSDDWPRYTLQTYPMDEVELPTRLTARRLAEWHDGDALSGRWVDVWEGDDDRDLVDAFADMFDPDAG